MITFRLVPVGVFLYREDAVEVDPSVETLLLDMLEVGVRGCTTRAVECAVELLELRGREEVELVLAPPKRASRFAVVVDRPVDLVPNRASRLPA